MINNFKDSNVNNKAYKVVPKSGKPYVVVGKTLLADGQFTMFCPSDVRKVVERMEREVADYNIKDQTISMLKIPYKTLNTPEAKQLICFATVATGEDYVLDEYRNLYDVKSIKCLGVIGVDYDLKTGKPLK